MTNGIRSYFDLGFRSSVRRRTVEEEVEEELEQRRAAIEQAKVDKGAAGGALRATSWKTSAVGLFVTVAVVTLAVAGQYVFKPALTYKVPWLSMGIVAGIVILLALLATLVHFLRGRRNPLYWEIACWALVAAGIVARQVVTTRPISLSLTALGISAIVSLAIFPALMKRINRTRKGPGLLHVAIPFSLGFFVDLSRVLASHYIPSLPWLRG